MSAKECSQCRFWRQRGPEGGEGECRRYPPQLSHDDGRGSWPITLANDWCGDFAPLADARRQYIETQQGLRHPDGTVEWFKESTGRRG